MVFFSVVELSTSKHYLFTLNVWTLFTAQILRPWQTMARESWKPKGSLINRGCKCCKSNPHNILIQLQCLLGARNSLCYSGHLFSVGVSNSSGYLYLSLCLPYMAHKGQLSVCNQSVLCALGCIGRAYAQHCVRRLQWCQLFYPSTPGILRGCDLKGQAQKDNMRRDNEWQEQRTLSSKCQWDIYIPFPEWKGSIIHHCLTKNNPLTLYIGTSKLPNTLSQLSLRAEQFGFIVSPRSQVHYPPPCLTHSKWISENEKTK